MGPDGKPVVKVQWQSPDEARLLRPALPATQSVLDAVLLDIFSDASLAAWVPEHLALEVTPQYAQLRGFTNGGDSAEASGRNATGGAATAVCTVDTSTAAEAALNVARCDLLDRTQMDSVEHLEGLSSQNLDSSAPAAQPTRRGSEGAQRVITNQDVYECGATVVDAAVPASALKNTHPRGHEGSVCALCSDECAPAAQVPAGLPVAPRQGECRGSLSDGIGAATSHGCEQEALDEAGAQWLRGAMRAPQLAVFTEYVLERLLLGLMQQAAEGDWDADD
jgi:hypothetical protein